jgi:hypothetical protein
MRFNEGHCLAFQCLALTALTYDNLGIVSMRSCSADD